MPRDKRTSTILYGSIVFVVLLIAGYAILSYNLSATLVNSVEGYLRDQLAVVASDATGGKVQIRVGDISLPILTSTISIRDVQVSYVDSTDSSGTKLSIRVPEATITGISIWEVLFDEGFDVNTIVVDRPWFAVRLWGDVPIDTISESIVDTSVFRLPRVPNVDSLINEITVAILPSGIAPLIVGTVQIKDASGQYSGSTPGSKLSGYYKHLNIQISNINLSDAYSAGEHVLTDMHVRVGQLQRSVTNETQLLFDGIAIDVSASDTSLTIDTVVYSTARGYSYKTHGAVVSFTKKRVTIDSFYIAPFQSDAEYFASKVFQTDRFRIKGRGLKLLDIDVPRLTLGDGLFARQAIIQSGALDILSTKRGKKSPSNNVPMVKDIINGLPFDLSIDSINLVNIRVLYGELYPETDTPASLEFTHVASVVLGMTNDTVLQKRQPLTINASGLFLSKTQMTVAIAMPMNSSQYRLDARGFMQSIDAKSLNSFLPVADNIRITHGYVDRASFAFSVTGRRATGFVDPLYRDLEFELLNRETKKSTFFGDITSFIANWVGIRNDNTVSDHKIGRINYVMRKNAAIVQTIWFPLRAGLSDVIGF